MNAAKTITAARKALRNGAAVYCTTPKGTTFRVLRIERVGANVFARDLSTARRRIIEPYSELHNGAGLIYGTC